MLFNIPDEHKRSSGIYVITNSINNKVYVGSAQHLKRRYDGHKSHYTRKKCTPKLFNAFIKHGIENFTFSILELCHVDIIIQREQYWIDTLEAVAKGYNISPTARTCKGVKRRYESIRKTADKHIGMKRSAETCKAISEGNKGKVRAEWMKQRHSEIMTGRKFTKEQIEAKIKKTNFKKWGAHSEETKARLSQMNKGKKMSEETKRKISENAKGNNKRFVSQYTKDGQLVKVWSSPVEAGKTLGLDRTSIAKSARGVIGVVGNYYWKYEQQIKNIA